MSLIKVKLDFANSSWGWHNFSKDHICFSSSLFETNAGNTKLDGGLPYETYLNIHELAINKIHASLELIEDNIALL